MCGLAGILRAVTLTALTAVGAATAGAANVNVLNNSAHEAGKLLRDLLILKPSGVVNVRAFVDRTTPLPNDNTFDPRIVVDALNTAKTYYSMSEDSAVNHAPYSIVSNSFTGYTRGVEPAFYAVLSAHGLLDDWAYTRALPAGTPPPIYSAAIDDGARGVTGPGVEFSLAPGYKGFDTKDLSSTVAGATAIFVAMKLDHPDWTWPDVKGALRQTASNWPHGYDATGHGYGVIDYDSADAIKSATALYLQPPIVTLTMHGRFARVTFYPFRQTRRKAEVLYAVPPAYVWPVRNEYTDADLRAAAAKLVYVSNDADVSPSFSYPASASRMLMVVALTTDGAGHYSRVESFCRSTLPVPAP
jgi:hypothetical protein